MGYQELEIKQESMIKDEYYHITTDEGVAVFKYKEPKDNDRVETFYSVNTLKGKEFKPNNQIYWITDRYCRLADDHE